MQHIILSICIPTYHRAELLRECLSSVIPQVASKDNVEVVVIDNASPDNTPAVVEEFRRHYPALRYYRNETNLGYTGNQIKCFELTCGDYMAILCDDDLYMPEAVSEILRVITDKEYAFVALNYFSFQSNVSKPYSSEFAPGKDVLFVRAYDVMKYPSVGHFSGFIFNTALARQALEQALSKKGLPYFENLRGIINEVAQRATSASTLPSFFIGQRQLATRMPAPSSVDYDIINHLCVNNLEYYYGLFEEGIITASDFEYRLELVLALLPRAIVVDSYRMTNSELAEVAEKLIFFLKRYSRFRFICLPMLLMARIEIIKRLFRCAHAVKRYLKWGRKQ